VNVDLYKQALHLDRQMVAEKKGLLGLSGPTFIYVGRLWAGKGVEYLIDAFRKLQELGIKSSLLVLGDGPDESIIRAHAAGLSEIHFAGFIQPEDVPQWYGLADALVFPTLGDPNGLVVEEAMAAGLPVISTENAGDIRSRIIEGRTGYVVPPFDSDALAHKMRVIAEDGELRRRLSSCAIQSAERYSVSKYADDFDSFVEGILSTPLRRNPSVFASQIIGRALVGLVRTVGATPSE
jgi:glycosyltransferase involved in cell wall biosynthesis